jgi:hypothetical protein
MSIKHAYKSAVPKRETNFDGCEHGGHGKGEMVTEKGTEIYL